MKLCNTCGNERESSQFHRRSASSDGLASKCKDCQSAYDKGRASLPHRVKQRGAYAKTERGAIKAREAKERWAKKNKARIYASTKRYREENPNKYRAHAKVAYEVSRGNLTRQPCEVCGCTESIHAHHDDYSKPLNVRWLCSKHHNLWHRDNGEGLNP